MYYNSIYFSYESLLQIVLVECKKGALPPPPPPGGSDTTYTDDNQNVFIRRCKEFMSYKMSSASMPKYVTLVMMQGMAPYSNSLVDFFDVKPQTLIYKFYQCINSPNFVTYEYLNATKWPIQY